MRRLLLPIIAIICGIYAWITEGDSSNILWIFIVGVWSLASYFSNTRTSGLEVLQRFRKRQLYYLSGLILFFGGWLVFYAYYNPFAGKWLSASATTFILFMLWLFMQWGIYSWNRVEARQRLQGEEHSRCIGIIIGVSTFLFAFLLIEGVMRLTMVQSDAYAFTAMHRAWLELYWQPINSLGYRDNEPDADETKTHILIVGDSFAAGHGINYIEDTFPHVLVQMLNEETDQYRVNIAAQPGWNSDAQLIGMTTYPIVPDVIILSYVWNDIAYALPTNPVQVQFPPPSISWLERRFFTVSFFYWHIYQAGVGDYSTPYLQTVVQGYMDDAIWARHEADLAQMLRWAQDRNIEFVVLLWNNLITPNRTQPALQRVSDFFTSQGVTVIDMFDVLANEDPANLVVNRYDAHPNIYAHRLAAEALYQYFR